MVRGHLGPGLIVFERLSWSNHCQPRRDVLKTKMYRVANNLPAWFHVDYIIGKTETCRTGLPRCGEA